MTDVVPPEKRSQMMAGIRGKNTKPELLVRSYLHQAGLRFRLHTALPGHPDIVLPKYRAVVFVHGCFWHRHGCRYTTTPSTNPAFWEKKFSANVRRDVRVQQQLAQMDWRVFVVWECEIGEPVLAKLAKTIKRGRQWRGTTKQTGGSRTSS